ncbi:MAG: flagellar biosynthesis anti-sigma factor FlgM [Phycisphaerales bacterium]
MSDIAAVSGVGGLGFDSLEGIPGAAERSRSAAARGTLMQRADSVEISDRARLMSRLRAMPDARQELVDRVRGELAMGTYETPDKLDATADGLIQDLGL